MADEKFFDTEKILIDFLGFIKKFLTTLYHCTFLPGKVIHTTYLKQSLGETNDLVKKNYFTKRLQQRTLYIDAFLYFTMAIILTISFYRTKLIVLANSLELSVKEKVLRSIHYFIETSLVEKMLYCFPIIFIIFWILKACSYRFKVSVGRRTEFLYFRPAFYYAFGTLIIGYIAIDYGASYLDLKGTLLSSNNLSLTFFGIYTACFCNRLYVDIKKNVYNAVNGDWLKKSEVTGYITILLLVLSYALNNSYEWILGVNGELNHPKEVTLSGNAPNNGVAGRLLTSVGNTQKIEGTCFLKNNSRSDVFLSLGTQGQVVVTDSKHNRFNGSLELLALDSSGNNVMQRIPANNVEPFAFRLTLPNNPGRIDSAVLGRPISLAISGLVLNYSPRTREERDPNTAFELSLF